MCMMCCKDEESINHLTLHCEITKNVWSFSRQTFGQQGCYSSSLKTCLLEPGGFFLRIRQGCSGRMWLELFRGFFGRKEMDWTGWFSQISGSLFLLFVILFSLRPLVAVLNIGCL